MGMLDLDDVGKELRSNGFAVRQGDLASVSLASAMHRTWSLGRQKSGAKVTFLRPMTQEQAPANTISATHGLAQQPLHTDGAHLKKMPDVVVLHAASPSSTGTVISKLPSVPPSAALHGVFSVRGNEGAFLAHAFAEQRIRFDPGCMSPADQLAKEAEAFFSSLHEHAHTHSWTTDNTLLFINNRNALHGRAAVTDSDDAETRKLSRATYFWTAP